jgi:Tol biopolymer transport system component
VREAIRITAERTFEALSADDQQAARQLFLRLVTPGEGKEDTRARAAMPVDSKLRKIVQQFAGSRTRLLVTGWDRASRPTVEVAHEALIRTWPRLRGWIDANREKLRARAAVLQAKAEWVQQERREDLLLPAGFQLERARALLADPGDITIDDIQEFIALSSAREKAERKRVNVTWAFAGVGAAILMAAAVSGLLMWEKARPLAQLGKAITEISTELDKAVRQQPPPTEEPGPVEREMMLALRRQFELEHARQNVLAELSGTKLLRGESASALRLASLGARLHFAQASPAAAALAAAVSQANWRFSLGGHDGGVLFAAFSRDGSRLVTASGDKTAHIWDVKTWKEIAVLRGHEDTVNSAAFSPAGSHIVTSSEDKTTRIWEAATWKEITVLRDHEDPVNSAAFSPDGSRVVTASDDKTARIWEVKTWKGIAALRGHEGSVNSAAFSPDGSRIVTASEDKTARIWDTKTRKEIALLRGHESSVNSVAFSPDGLRIVTASEDQTARIWDVKTWKEIAVLRGHDESVTSAAFSPDGLRIITTSSDRTARIWDVASAKEIVILRGHEGSVNFAAFSPDGSRIVTASGDNTARIWDAHLQTMSVKDLLVQACERLAGVTKLTREEMRLAGYPDSTPEIDVCKE